MRRENICKREKEVWAKKNTSCYILITKKLIFVTGAVHFVGETLGTDLQAKASPLHNGSNNNREFVR